MTWMSSQTPERLRPARTYRHRDLVSAINAADRETARASDRLIAAGWVFIAVVVISLVALLEQPEDWTLFFLGSSTLITFAASWWLACRGWCDDAEAAFRRARSIYMAALAGGAVEFTNSTNTHAAAA